MVAPIDLEGQDRGDLAGPSAAHTLDTVGKRIAHARKDKKMSQAKLATPQGISRSAVAQWERDATSPPIATIEQIAMILDVSAEWLAFGTDTSQPAASRLLAPENFSLITEVRYGDRPDAPEAVGMWGAPKEWVLRQSASTPENLRIVEVRSDGAGLRRGEKVLVDTGSTRPSPAGAFLYWDGMGAVFARMRVVPGAGEPHVHIDMDGDTVELPLSKLKVIGRVVGRWSDS